MSYPEKPRSNGWLLLPIFFGMIGGLIAFFIIRHDDLYSSNVCKINSVVCFENSGSSVMRKY